jgi:hypothetical protein
VSSLVECSNFVLSEMEDRLQVDAVYTDFLKAFDMVNHGLLLGTLTQKFRPLMQIHLVFSWVETGDVSICHW